MIHAIVRLLERAFTVIILMAAVIGFCFPGIFLWLKPYVPELLGSVMFGIGLTVHEDQLKNLVRQPSVLLLALGKFCVMPVLAYGIALALQLPPEAVVGMVILGACPGGASANVMTYLVRGNSALTVMLTIATTILSPILTPFIIHLFSHHTVNVNVKDMMEKLFWVVMFPVVDAIIVRRFLFRYVEPVQYLFPPISIMAVGLIIGFVAAANRATLSSHPWGLIAGVLAFNLGGYGIGYAIGRVCRFDAQSCRSIAFEYGMQDSSLGIMLATSFFSALTALPSAICSLAQNLTGPFLVRCWSGKVLPNPVILSAAKNLPFDILTGDPSASPQDDNM